VAVAEKPTSPLRTLTRLGIGVGLLAAVFGLAWWAAFRPGRWQASVPVIGPLAGGLALAAACVLLNLRWLARLLRSRRGAAALNTLIAILLAVIILVVVNLIGMRQFRTWDLTERGRHTLDDRTLAVLDSLEDRLEITAVLHGTEELLGIQFAEKLRRLLQRYADRSPWIEISYVDQVRDPDRARVLAQELGVKPRADSVIFRYRDRTRLVSAQDMLVYPPRDSRAKAGPQPKFRAEEPFTRAIMSVASERQRKVLFTVGHGERSLSDTGDGGFSEIAQALRRSNYAVAGMDLFAGRESLLGASVEADVIVVAGPRTAFEQPVADALVRCLQRKGGPALLLMFEPRTMGGNAGRLAPLCETFGIRVRDDVLVQTFRMIADNLGHISFRVQRDVETTDLNERHPITRDLKTLGARFILSGALEPVRPTRGYRWSVLVRSPKGTWGETNFTDRNKTFQYTSDEDLAGPLSLAAVGVAEKTGGPRLAVFADTDFAANSGLSQAPGNRPLFLNTVAWLAADEERIGIERPEDARPVAARPGAPLTTFLICVVGMPFLTIAAGGLVWWRRRR